MEFISGPFLSHVYILVLKHKGNQKKGGGFYVSLKITEGGYMTLTDCFQAPFTMGYLLNYFRDYNGSNQFGF